MKLKFTSILFFLFFFLLLSPSRVFATSFTDIFDGSDGQLLPDHKSEWECLINPASIINQTAYASGDSYCISNNTWTDGYAEITADITLYTSRMRVLARNNTYPNQYICEVRPDGSGILKGSDYLATGYTTTSLGTHTLKCEVIGNTITEYFDGVAILQISDSSVTSGNAGFFLDGVTATYDNWTSHDYGSEPPSPSPTPTPFYSSFTDDFTGDDNTDLHAHSPSWVCLIGPSFILNYAAQSGGDSYCISNNVWADGYAQITGTYTSLPAQMRVLARNNTYPNQYICHMDQTGAYILKGSEILISSAIPALTTGAHTLKCEVVGTTIKQYYDGVQVLEVSDSSIVSGNAGFFLDGSKATYDDWYSCNGTCAVTPTPTPTPTPTNTPTPTETPTPTPVPNVAPVVGAITAPTAPVVVNTQVNASANFTDGNAGDTHTAVWDWGDGFTSLGDVTESNGSGSVAGSHVYLTPNVYTVTLTVTDNQNADDVETFKYVSVYNPTPQGLFSGARLFTSPAGSYPEQPNVSGQVKFGVTAKYQGTILVGDVDMSIKQVNFEFNSTVVTILVTADGKATLRGEGTIEGRSGTYKFLVTGIDGTNDTIRFQITDPSNNDAVVYDSQIGAADTDDPTAAVIGQVIVH